MDQPLWGRQTELSLQYFAIGEQRMPTEIVRCIAWVKWAAAHVNSELGLLEPSKAYAIALIAARIGNGQLPNQFPLSVWQTGSGTQSHMNVNEVIASLASTPNSKIHPNDDVNRGQSSNDVFPTALNLAIILSCNARLLPATKHLRFALQNKITEFTPVIKIGRTHLQDAIPIALAQEFSGYDAQVGSFEANVQHPLAMLHALAIGGTAIGTGFNTHPQFGSRVAHRLSEKFKLPLVQSSNLFASIAGAENLVAYHSVLKQLALSLIKIGNDIRLMGSGPRAGLGELRLPQNEPGSSMMPGKVNPTQIEALNMVAAQVMGHDLAISFAASQGQFELNVFQPLFALNILDSTRLLADAVNGFTNHCVAGIRVDKARIDDLLQRSLMLVTALTPHIGYEKSSQIVQHASEKNMTLRQAALELKTVSAADFDCWVDPQKMISSQQ